MVVALAGPLRAQPAPLSLLDVPFISQSEALCGGAAAAMVLRYWGARGLDAESFAHLVDESAAGIRTDALIGELVRRGWTAVGVRGAAPQIAAELARGRPVLALIEERPGTYHYVVLVAATSTAIVFHDPARAPFRVMGHEEFGRRWAAAGRWMAVVVPGEAAAAPVSAIGSATPVADGSCDGRVAEGVRLAQAGELDAAERLLTGALACPGPAAMRELAGVRLLQRRWSDVEALARAVVDTAPDDEYAWRLLGTSRFVQDEPRAALEAWNVLGEPAVDLVRVAGLTRTRQRPVERLIGLPSGETLTPDAWLRSRRRLDDLPSATATRLTYAPVTGGLVEMRAAVTERPLVPEGVGSYAAMGLLAAARREVEFTVGSLTGGGERSSGAYRFWPDRPRVRLSFDAPAPWGGIWGVEAMAERQPFTDDRIETAERRAVTLTASNWVSGVVRLEGRVGLERVAPGATAGRAGGTWRLWTPGDRVDVAVSGDFWGGGASFGRVDGAIEARSRAQHQGWVWIGRAGGGAVSAGAPLERWLAGDTGLTRDMLLRAHPLVDDGALRVARLGRRIAYASGEVRRWWTAPLVRVGAAVFADAARTGGRAARRPRGDVDAGAGLRVAIPGVRGVFRVDLARGFADGATAFSFVYEP